MKVPAWLASLARTPRSQRRSCAVTAHYWNGGCSIEAGIKDISTSGAYLLGPDRWYIGTVLRVTLQLTGDAVEPASSNSIILSCKVVRQGPDGIGVAFMLSDTKETKALREFISRSVRRQKGSGNHSNEQGQALIEFALMVPLLFLLIVNVVNFGGLLYDTITVTNAARAGAQYAALGASSVKTPPEATFSQVQALVQQETSSLPNWSNSTTSPNPVVAVCVNNNGTETVLNSSPATSCTTAPTDPEIAVASSAYTNVAVDVTYTYSPFIPVFSFPSLGIYATIPSTTIHRRTIMRVLN